MVLDADKATVKLIDFGFAALLEDESVVGDRCGYVTLIKPIDYIL